MPKLTSIVSDSAGDQRMGKLLIDWARAGKQRKEGDPPEAGWPATLEQFMSDVGAGWIDENGDPIGLPASVMVPDRIKAIQFVQSNMETLLIRLPPKELVEASLERLKEPGGEAYNVPDFYKDAVENPPTTEDEKLALFQHRVGDYVIAHCM